MTTKLGDKIEAKNWRTGKVEQGTITEIDLAQKVIQITFEDGAKTSAELWQTWTH